ncbi:unnamed protein product [Schistosoma turkestanicum]|nr:unnamed protein product [Schistosoma turkestanicum]
MYFGVLISKLRATLSKLSRRIILIYTDLAQGTEMTQVYTISYKDTVKDVIKQILARNHLNLKDPNLFYLTYRRQMNNENHTTNTTTTNSNGISNKHLKPKQHAFLTNLYETMESSAQASNIWSLNQITKEIDITLYSDAILSRTLDLTKDNRLTLHMQTGGVLKIYDSCFSNPASIRQFHIAKTTCSEELIDLILTVTCSNDPVTDYCLVEEGINEEGRILRPKDYPLLIVQSNQSSGLLVLRKKEDALVRCKGRSTWMNSTKPYFRRSIRDKQSRTPSPVKQTLTQRLNLFPCIFKGLTKSRLLEQINHSSESMPLFDKTDFIESESQTTPPSYGNGYYTNEKPNRPVTTKSLPQRYGNHLDSKDKFEIFNPFNNNNKESSDHLRSMNRCTINNDHKNSEWSLAPSELHHPMKATSISPPLPPKLMNTKARYNNINNTTNAEIQHRYYNSYQPCVYEKQSIELSKSNHSNSLASTEVNKLCRPEKSASPILAFDANRRTCESRQSSAVRFQENTNSSGIWTKENECSLKDATSTVQSNEYNKAKLYVDRAQSSDSIQTFTAADWDDKTISREKVTDSVNIGATYDNGCNDTIIEYDVPADSCIDWKYSNPQPIVYNSYTEEKCSEKQNGNYCANPISSRFLNATQISENKSHIQQKKYQRGDRSEENKHEPGVQTHTDFGTTMNGDYDESFNDNPPKKSDFDRIQQQNSYTQVNSSNNVKLNQPNNNSSSESRRMKVMDSFETINTTQSCEDISLYNKHQMICHSQNDLHTENYSSTSHLSVPTPFHDSDMNVSMISKENMLTLSTELPVNSVGLKQYETHVELSPNLSSIHNHSNNNTKKDSDNNHHHHHHHHNRNNNFSTVFQQHPTSQIHKLFTYNFEAMPNHMNNSQSSIEMINVENGKTIILNNATHLKHKKHSSHSAKHNGTSILVHGCKKTHPSSSSSDLETVESYPSLFDVLHHCDIYRVLLDPNLPSLSDQLGLRLCLTKFPLDDVQRADTLQKLQKNEIVDVKSSYGIIEPMNPMHSPKGPKPYIGLRSDGAFKPIDVKRSDMAFDVVTIESIETDSPASFEGSLAPGHIILEVDGKDLLRPKQFKDSHGNKVNILAIAQNQLRAARQAALNGEIPPIRITAARYHDNFGLANTVSNLDRSRFKNGFINRNVNMSSTINDTFDKQQPTTDVIVHENIQQYTTDFDQTHETTQSFKTSDPSEIYSKCPSEFTDYSEDILETLKNKLIWFSRNQQENTNQSNI